ncbi:hypothetical protein [Streptomyces tricolor]|nr:hypothetical protein [Streptomyces tricolor]
MLNAMCQVCSRPAGPDGGPYFWLLRSTGGPIQDGERTASPPVHVPCAAISVQLCGALRGGRYVTAWVDAAPVWGVAGVFYSPRTLKPTVSKLEYIEYGAPDARWSVAHRQVVQLHGVRPADLNAEIARLGTDRLEQEFARVAGLVGAGR